MFSVMFTDEVATEYRDWANTDHELYDAIAIGMHARGAMPEPDSREPWFVCEAHAQGDTSTGLTTSVIARRGPRGAHVASMRPLAAGNRAGARSTEGCEGMTLDGNAVRSVDRAAALLLALGRAMARRA